MIDIYTWIANKCIDKKKKNGECTETMQCFKFKGLCIVCLRISIAGSN